MKRSLRGVVFGILMLAVSVLSLSTASSAEIGIGISVRIGPPALPVYAQPVCPGPGYFWTPGYWAWDDDAGYYWVPGTWVVAPVGMLWTPGYWAFSGGYYGWHPGYWGRHVGFYGGINYGFGYGGVGFYGGEWRGGSFFYNRSVTNVRVTNITNVYNRTVIVNNTHVSYNGPGGIEARPTPQEREFEREPHTGALAMQTQHERAASQNRLLRASENHGRPAIAATARPGEFSGRNIVRARAAGEPYRAPKISPREARAQSTSDRRPNESSKNAYNDRAMARPENHPATNNAARNNAVRDNAVRQNAARNNTVRDNGVRDNAARNNATRNNAVRDNPVRNNAARNPGQMSSRDNPRPNQPNRAELNQERMAQPHSRDAQKREEKVNRAPAKAEQKRNAPEQHR